MAYSENRKTADPAAKDFGKAAGALALPAGHIAADTVIHR
jgi:hypothetical protein